MADVSAGRPDPLEVDPRHLRALVDVARLVNDGVTRQDRVAAGAVQAATLVGDAAAVWVQPVGTEGLQRIAATDDDPADAPPPAADTYGGDGLIEAVTDSGTPVVLDAEDVGGYLGSIRAALGPWAQQRSIAGAAIIPMRSKGLSGGVLAVARDAAAVPFTASEIDFLEALAGITAATLGTCNVLHGSALAVEEMRQQAELVDHVSDAVVAWDNDGRVITWNAAAESIYGYSSAETLGCDVHALLNTRFIDPGEESRTYPELAPELVKTGTGGASCASGASTARRSNCCAR